MDLSSQSTRELWGLSNPGLYGPHVVESAGAELMRRTDTSPERREQATTEQAERRAEMRRSGADRRYAV